MPTATMTTPSKTTIIPLNKSHPTASTLRSLYNRAARAFLLRDVVQTHSLLISAFAILAPPTLATPDALVAHRRKWDILRITLETTVYSSPPSETDKLPLELREILTMSPQLLLGKLHARSLALFTPTPTHTPTSAYLPSQVLITLVLSSMKLDCPEVGRGLIEDWLARRGQGEQVLGEEGEGDGYGKVLDMYCLHVLPRLEEWDYAREFLVYEGELPPHTRENLVTSLQSLYTETMSSRRPPSPIIPILSPDSPRTVSPAPSSSSSLSTTSTHTAVPRTPRPNSLVPNSLSGLTPSASSTSVASDETITKRRSNSHLGNGSSRRPGTSQSNSTSTSVSSSSVLPRPPRSHPLEPPSSTPRPPSTLALIRASLSPYLTSSKIGTFILLFVLLPVLSLVMRIRRKRIGSGTMTQGAAADVRRRLAAGQDARAGVIGSVWKEVVRAVGDTIRMGGGGLV